MNSKYEPLFQTFTLPNDVELKNRIVMAPMTNFSSNEDGTVTEQEVEYYVRRASGVSMVITACTYVTPNGKGFHGEFGADRDELIPSLKQLAQAIKAEGAKAVLQIFHGGRMCPPELVPNGEVVSASAVAAEGEGHPVPRELNNQEIEDIIKAFGETTRRAVEAGFDGVEIHGANGYLIQQFFSPHSNRRDDRWGGSLEKRLSFPLAVVSEVKKAAAAAARPFIVGYRFSPEEPETPGITMADTLQLIDALSDQGLDYLHISLQDYTSVPRRGVEDTRSRLEIIQKRAGNKVPVIGVGSILTADDAIKAFQTGVPLLALGRELIMDPDWLHKIEQGKEDEIVTKILKDKQRELVVPDPLWQAIVNTPGWFPGV
ncbi:NADH-dependent flavin oxidoreductase [Peribacillus deserti]|uniref:NADH-dependent flavin oxidoreductase n=1 Tax=Peribacillus deserti TaxID=673318 RepID=A0A2N5LZC1_9BACI|nr:NADH-dependent flavin oxidoreductase [Peribacillus deserti]PLT27462.1 NADH-dependent flavin oxidoreductase [Peribacillus deserti]